MLRIVVLGSGAGGGVPQWNSNAEACRRARSRDPVSRDPVSRDPALPGRTQSSLALSADGGRWFLLNASPDLRQQIIETQCLHPRTGFRDSPIAGVILTNADVDHVAGLLTLREGHRFAVWATTRVLGVLAANPIFGVLAPELVTRCRLPLGDAVAILDGAGQPAGFQVEAFAVPGKVALWLEDAAAGANFGTVAEDTIGLAIRPDDGGPGFFYIPGCASVTGEVADRLRGAALVLFDGTLWDDDELIRQGGMAKTGGRMGHVCMSGPQGSLMALGGLGIARKVFVHINNTNPVLLPESAERATAAAAGWEIGFDGMEIAL
ncbi:MAG: pyrroloquinoline quinone biosynthesis protein PqqB [Azospirillum sp.]|nr:pyrroloquinoline quinone biosynthesis protein PqqB [Azospirillum sp.]